MQGINDIMRVTRVELIAYGHFVSLTCANNYARNLISSVNVILQSVRCDKNVRVEPAEVLAQRKSSRTTQPAGMEFDGVNQAANDLVVNRQGRVALVVLLTWHFGLRLKEACLMDLRAALRQAKKYGAIDVRQGTKGGRGKHVARWVPVSPEALAVLIWAQKMATDNGNLVPDDKSLIQFTRRVHKQWDKVRGKYGLEKIHDLRSAYACRRYQSMTAHPAPACNSGQISADKGVDRNARETVILELGHGHRRRIINYIGGAR
jgi:integrase